MESKMDYNLSEDLLTDSDLHKEVVYAGFWLRFAAYLLDGIVLAIPNLIITYSFNIGPIYDIDTGTNLLAIVVQYSLFLYFPIMESSKLQATLGKRLIGLKVTDLEGGRISFGRAVVKVLASILSCIILFIGYIMIGLTERKQALHDLIAGTLVVKI